jgi:hypothetical protein
MRLAQTETLWYLGRRTMARFSDGKAAVRCLLLDWLHRKFLVRSLILTAFLLSTAAIQQTFAQSVADHPDWPGKGQLFVGTCYQPIDRTPEEIRRDIAIMKKAGFNLVHMGDLSWDSFEPSEGRFEFAWFDEIMDEAAGFCCEK